MQERRSRGDHSTGSPFGCRKANGGSRAASRSIPNGLRAENRLPPEPLALSSSEQCDLEHVARLRSLCRLSQPKQNRNFNLTFLCLTTRRFGDTALVREKKEFKFTLQWQRLSKNLPPKLCPKRISIPEGEYFLVRLLGVTRFCINFCLIALVMVRRLNARCLTATIPNSSEPVAKRTGWRQETNSMEGR